MVARRQGDPGPRAAAHDRKGESRGSAAEGGGGRGRDGAAGCVVGCWILFSRLKEKHAPADGWAPGANALGSECPPSSADDRRLLLVYVGRAYCRVMLFLSLLILVCAGSLQKKK